ncbi:MAG TPA: SUF system Fe-S cluster assembly protein [Rhizobiales bacterium]|nr:SUF system Fe-S cluster assembly protein [Hyphomicrobiales bacterium]
MSETETETESCAPVQDEKAVAAPVTHEVPETEAAKSAIPAEELNRMTNDIIAAIKTVYDPEIPVDIFELGLIYKIDISDDRVISIDMTLTAPGCPVAGEMPVWVQNAVSTVEGVMDVKVEMVFDPPWDMSRMSEEAQIALNMY